MEENLYSRRIFNITVSRRSFFKSLAVGTASLGGSILHRAPENAYSATEPSSEISRVSFVTGKDRRDMVYQVMKPFEKEIKKGIKDKQLIIKPNFVVNNIPLCATHADAIRGVLDFVKPFYKKTVIIGESTVSSTGTDVGFQNYGYRPLEREYNVKLVDLNKQPFTTHWILGKNNCPLAINIIDTFVDPQNYIISITRLKTHDTVVATLTLKNIIMGSPVNHYDKGGNEKGRMHEGQPVGLNYNIFLLSRKMRPHFSILDGVEGMEGNGPVNGTAVEHGVALAGTDYIAVDRVGVELMGINYEDIAYLQWCARAGMGKDNLSQNIKILGPDPSLYTIKYKLHENIEWQLGWKEK